MVTTPDADLVMVQDVLRAVPFFRELTQPELDLLVALGRVVAYPKEMVVFREGDTGEALYVLIHGAVRIVKQAPDAWDGTMAFVEQGGCFGEMALVDDFPRSATAITQDECTILFLGRDALLDLFREEPVVGRKILAALCRSLSLRLRQASDHIVALSSLQRGT
jgi:CRP/FNR family transcriptional regulator, cyclic AMP receptor protein